MGFYLVFVLIPSVIGIFKGKRIDTRIKKCLTGNFMLFVVSVIQGTGSCQVSAGGIAAYADSIGIDGKGVTVLAHKPDGIYTIMESFGKRIFGCQPIIN